MSGYQNVFIWQTGYRNHGGIAAKSIKGTGSCGQPTFPSETTEKIQNSVHGSSIPVRTKALDVFALT